MRAIDGYDGRLLTKFALRLIPLLFVRPGELRHAVWDEFDLTLREWRIPAGPDEATRISGTWCRLARQARSLLLADSKPLTGRGRARASLSELTLEDRPMSGQRR